MAKNAEDKVVDTGESGASSSVPASAPEAQRNALGVAEAIALAAKSAGKRKFAQSWDLFVSLRDLDMKKPESRLNEELDLPHGRGRPARVAVIADALSSRAEGVADTVIKKDDLAAYGANKKNVKKLANDIDYFFAEASLMPLVGKTLGGVLGPRNKMPKPLQPNADIKPLVERYRKTVRVRTREAPVVHVLVGIEGMNMKHVADNVDAVLGLLERKLPKGKNNIRGALVKLTMGAPVRIKV